MSSAKRDALRKLKEKNYQTNKAIDERETPVDDLPVVVEDAEDSVNRNDVNQIVEIKKEAPIPSENNEEKKSEINEEIIYISNKTTKSSASKTKRKLGKQIEISAASTISWTCKIESETYLNFQLLVADQGTNKLELINRIIDNEKDWQSKNPEFPERAFVLENLKNKSTAQNGDYVSATFNITKANNTFLKKSSQKCGMKMYVFLTYLINEYSKGLI